jgi:hypothetical protein
MKKLFSAKIGYLIFALVLVISSCEHDTTVLDFPKADFSKFYGSRSDFEMEVKGFRDSIFLPGFTHFDPRGFSDLDHVKWYMQLTYADARDSLGRSNWADPAITKDTSLLDWRGRVFDSAVFNLMYQVNVDYVGPLNSPPAHLHLCLTKWNQDTTGARLGRTWKVGAIVDTRGNDLTTDPDWIYYADNTMRFEKTNRFVFTPGEERSEQEIDLFGTATKHPTIIGSYSVKKSPSGGVELKLIFPKFNSTLLVLESRFGYIKLSGESGGKKGVLVLVPVA